ncbi:MAG: HNH endonuclease [Xanthobacteraceae bacterium]
MATPISSGEPITRKMICETGYSKCVRRVTKADKMDVFSRYELKGNHTGYCGSKRGCEIDHLIPLDLGGSNDLTNLWPHQFHGIEWNADRKDRLEAALHAEVCAEPPQMSVEQAQGEISTNWIESYRKHLR